MRTWCRNVRMRILRGRRAGPGCWLSCCRMMRPRRSSGICASMGSSRAACEETPRLELRSGQPARRGQRGAGYEYNLIKSRQEERQRGERAETAYKRLTEGWTKRGNQVPADASTKVRQ